MIDNNSNLIQTDERIVPATEVSPHNHILSRAVEEEEEFINTSSINQRKNENDDDLSRFIEEKKQDFAILNHGKKYSSYI